MIISGSRYACWTLLVYALVLSSCLNAGALADTNGLKKEPDFQRRNLSKLSPKEIDLLKEFYRNYLRLESFYANITMVAHEETSSLPRSSDGTFPPVPNAKLEIVQVRELTFRANGGQYYRMDGIQYSAPDLTKKTFVGVGIITPTEGYLFEKTPSTDRYYVSAHGKNRDEYVGAICRYIFPIAPFSNEETKLEHMLRNESTGFSINRVETAHGPDGELATIWTSAETGRHRAAGVYQFYRDRSWALKEHVGNSKSDDPSNSYDLTTTQTCSYGGEKGGAPLLRNCTIAVTDNASGNKVVVSRQVFEITKIVPGASPLAEFDTRQFIEKQSISETGVFPHFRVVCILLGLISLLIGIFVRRRMVVRT